MIFLANFYLLQNDHGLMALFYRKPNLLKTRKIIKSIDISDLCVN